MSFFSRIGKIVGSGLDLAGTAPGTIIDLAKAPFVEDEVDGFANTLFEITSRRAGDVVSRAIGPSGVGGEFVGGLPEGVRAPIRGPVNKVFDISEGIYREAISEPISTAVQTQTLSRSARYRELNPDVVSPKDEPIGSIKNLFNVDLFKDAHKIIEGKTPPELRSASEIDTVELTPELTDMIDPSGAVRQIWDTHGQLPPEIDGDLRKMLKQQVAATRSPGQSIALWSEAVGNEDFDVLNDMDVLNKMATDGYQTVSGVADGVFRWQLDPSVIAGKAYKGARQGYMYKGFSAEDINTIMRLPSTENFLQRLKTETGEPLSPGRIRDEIFPNHPQGDAIATVLAQATSRGDDAARSTLKGLMGDAGEVTRLGEQHADLTGQIDRLTAQKNKLIDWDEGTLFDDAAEIKQATAEVNSLTAARTFVDKALDAAGSIQDAPYISAGSKMRKAVKSSFLYQKDIFSRPLHAVSDKLPPLFVNLHGPGGDTALNDITKFGDLDTGVADGFRTRFMATNDPLTRQQVLVEAENAAIDKIASSKGLLREEVEAVMDMAHHQRNRALNHIKSSGQYDGLGKNKISYIDDQGVLHEVNVPIWRTQEANVHVVAPLNEFAKSAKEITRYRGRFKALSKLPLNEDLAAQLQFKAKSGLVGQPMMMPFFDNLAVKQAPGLMMETLYDVWRPMVLGRVGWPMRIVGEGELRAFAKIGVWNQLHSIFSQATGESGFRAIPENLRSARTRLKEGLNGVPKDMRTPFEFHPRGGSKALQIETPGGHRYDLGTAFGAPGDIENLYQGWASASDSWQGFVGGPEVAQLKKLHHATRNWGSYLPDHKDYGVMYERAVNMQIAQDPMGRRFLSPKNAERAPDLVINDVKNWLLTKKAGQEYARSRRIDINNIDEKLGIAADQLYRYLPTPELRSLARDKSAKHADLQRLLPDISEQPIVHGELLDYNFGKGSMRQAFDRIAQGVFDKLGRAPDDYLVRHPYFDHMYRAESARLVDLYDSQGLALNSDMVGRIKQQARNFALNEGQKTFYRFVDQTRAGHALKFVAPFYQAFQEVTTQWMGIAAHNPPFVARARLVWNSPEKAGVVTDENGNWIGEDGKSYTAFGKEVPKEMLGKERFINMVLPKEIAEKLPFVDKLPERAGHVRLNKRSFNIVLQGLPFNGPIVQIPANEIVKRRPDLEKTLQTVLPFGVQQNSFTSLLSPTVRRAYTNMKGEDDIAYRNTALRIYGESLTDWSRGLRDKPLDWETEVIPQTDAFFSMRTWANYLSPVAPSFVSPYQPFIDAYNNANGRYYKDNSALGTPDDPERNPDAWFLDTFGPEFFPLTQSLSKSIDGVPPTKEAYEKRKEYKELIEEHPELGGLIVGEVGDEFSYFVYQHQLATPLKPGSAQNQRQSFHFDDISLEEGKESAMVKLAWLEYRRFMDLLEGERIQRGLPNLQVKAATDLQAKKEEMIDLLAEQYPVWYEEYEGGGDKSYQRKLIEGMRAVSADSTLSKRRDIQILGEYLDLRDAFVSELSSRPSVSLSSQANFDLKGAWDELVGDMIQRNTGFGDIYYRYLERDDLVGEK